MLFLFSRKWLPFIEMVTNFRKGTSAQIRNDFSFKMIPSSLLGHFWYRLWTPGKRLCATLYMCLQQKISKSSKKRMKILRTRLLAYPSIGFNAIPMTFPETLSTAAQGNAVGVLVSQARTYPLCVTTYTSPVIQSKLRPLNDPSEIEFTCNYIS